MASKFFKLLKLKPKKSVFVKDKSGTITGVKPGSKIGKKKSWKDHVDTSHPSYKKEYEGL